MAYGTVKVDTIVTSTQTVDVDDLVSTAGTAVQPGDIGTAAALDTGTSAGNIPVLDGAGKIVSTVLPSYVDDVLEYANLAAFPATGETGKIYVALDSNKTYRWSGSTYIEISSSPVISVAGRTGAVTLSNTDISGLGTAATTAATDYAPAAQGVTNGNSHDHNGGDGAQIAYSSLSGTPTLGTAAALNVGTSANNVVQLDGSAKLPAVDGSALTGIVTTTDLSYTASTRVIASSTGADATLPLVTSTEAGLAPASGGGTTTFLRADGTWATTGSSPGGSDTQIQFNDGGVFGGDVDLTYNKTTNKLTTKGDVELNDGGSFTTTLQCVTPTAARTISFPDATGTVGLVGGSSGQVIYNNAGAYAGLSTFTADGSGNVTLTGRMTNSTNGAASAPASTLTGTWFTGGTATTTKPQFLLEPAGATSTAWSTSGTGLGINAASGFTGRLLDAQVNGTSRMVLTGDGSLGVGTTSPGFRFHAVGGIINTTSTAKFQTSDLNSGSIDFGFSTTYTGLRIAHDAVIAGGSIYNSVHFGSAAHIFQVDSVERLRIRATGLISFGGTTSSFPALKRNSAQLQIRLADDSADAALSCAALTVSGNLTISTKDIVTDTTTGTKIGTATTQKLAFYNATPVVQPTAVADLTTTATAGSLPTPNGTVTIADATTPTVVELLEYCVELEAKLEAALSRLRDLGLIAT